MKFPVANATLEFIEGMVRLGLDPNGVHVQHRHGAREARRIALTFDDGPTLATAPVLDVLRRHNVRATFFVVGKHLRGLRQIACQAVVDGHEIGNHTWNHDLRGDWFTDLGQLAVTSATIQETTGVRARLFRPPFGHLSQRLSRIAAAAGMAPIGWDVDSLDWRKPVPEDLARRVLAATRGGSIILLHDGPQTEPARIAAALEKLLPRLAEHGYECVTVSELLDGQLVSR
jgi:peptidoglycan/xylan/chitin deacetylase (PgdA/CDA1 family)